MIDRSAKDVLHQELQWAREAMVWKLDGLSEYDVRRPLTATGTNLLGLVKHLATWEAWYFGEVFGRPFPGPVLPWQDSEGSDLWVTADESRDQVVDFYRRAWQHADATIGELPLDAPGCASSSTAGPVSPPAGRSPSTPPRGRLTAGGSRRRPGPPPGPDSSRQAAPGTPATPSRARSVTGRTPRCRPARPA